MDKNYRIHSSVTCSWKLKAQVDEMKLQSSALGDIFYVERRLGNRFVETCFILHSRRIAAGLFADFDNIISLCVEQVDFIDPLRESHFRKPSVELVGILK